MAFRRRAAISLVGLMLFAGCGRPLTETAGGKSSSGERPNETLKGVGLPPTWEEAVRNANFPLAVAYGLPDHQQSLDETLFRSLQIKIADCMSAEGFTFEPEILAADSRANAESQNALPLEARAHYNNAYDSCFETSSAKTYIVNALAARGDVSEWDNEVEFIIGNRELILELAQGLER